MKVQSQAMGAPTGDIDSVALGVIRDASAATSCQWYPQSTHYLHARNQNLRPVVIGDSPRTKHIPNHHVHRCAIRPIVSLWGPPGWMPFTNCRLVSSSLTPSHLRTGFVPICRVEHQRGKVSGPLQHQRPFHRGCALSGGHGFGVISLSPLRIRPPDKGDAVVVVITCMLRVFEYPSGHRSLKIHPRFIVIPRILATHPGKGDRRYGVRRLLA